MFAERVLVSRSPYQHTVNGVNHRFSSNADSSTRTSNTCSVRGLTLRSTSDSTRLTVVVCCRRTPPTSVDVAMACRATGPKTSTRAITVAFRRRFASLRSSPARADTRTTRGRTPANHSTAPTRPSFPSAYRSVSGPPTT